MNTISFTMISDLESKLPFYLNSIGIDFEEQHIKRPNGHNTFLWIQSKSGTGNLILRGEKHIIDENNGFLLFPNEPHEYYGVTDLWIVNWICFDGFSLKEFFRNMKIESSKVFNIAYPDIINSSMIKILNVAISNSMLTGIECSKALYEFLMDLSTYCYTEENNHVIEQHSKFKEVFSYIDDNYMKVITLEKLSEITNLTPEYFCSLFKETTGIRVFEYINRVRIKYSKVLMLKHRDMPLKEVASLCGFENTSYFCAVFKKVENLTAGTFKKLH
jgi:AraC-like DNA-binding protein